MSNAKARGESSAKKNKRKARGRAGKNGRNWRTGDGDDKKMEGPRERLASTRAKRRAGVREGER